MSQRYKKVPKQLRYICQMLENNNSRYVPIQRKIKPQKLITDIQELCRWLSKHCLAKKVWFRIVERLVSVFKLSILCYIKDGLKEILDSKTKLKRFKKRGQTLIVMIWKIVEQVGSHVWFVNFNLMTQWKLAQKLNMDRLCIHRVEESEMLNVKLTQSELEVYKFLAKTQIWATKVDKTFDQRICMTSYRKNKISLQTYFNSIEGIQQERKFIEAKHAQNFNAIETRFYHACLKFYFKVKRQLENLQQKIQRRKRRKELQKANQNRQSQAPQPQFSQDSDTEQRKDDSKSQKNSDMYQDTSKDKGDEEEYSVSEDTNNLIQQKHCVKRQWPGESSSSDDEDIQEGELSMENVFFLPPDEQSDYTQKIQNQTYVKTQVSSRQQQINRMRNLIREKRQKAYKYPDEQFQLPLKKKIREVFILDD